MSRDELEELKKVANKSTRVVGWYAHPYEGEVRGPFGRWFTCTGGENAGVQPESVADISDDCKFAAAAMNNLVPLLEHIEKLEKEIIDLTIEEELTGNRND